MLIVQMLMQMLNHYWTLLNQTEHIILIKQLNEFIIELI